MLTLAEIGQATGGQILSGEGSSKITSVSIDTRTIKPGSLFIAIKGERFDGHQFVRAAVGLGAVAVMVSRPVKLPKGVAVVRVADTTLALGLLARFHRQRFPGTVIAITGSAGKTTTKNVLSEVLKTKYQVLKSERSENNWIGVPLTLLKLRPEHQLAVVEAGTNQRGDMAWLARLIQPDIVILTNIGDTHLERLKSRRGVYREKINLAKGMAEPGVIIYNADDPQLELLKSESLRCRLKSFAVEKSADCRAKNVRVTAAGKTRFEVRSNSYSLPAPGRHHIYNALACLSCARLLNVPADAAKRALAKAMPDHNRGSLLRSHGRWVLDDSYNANPLSFQRALEVLAGFTPAKRRIVVCGDMRELGHASEKLHRALGKEMALRQVDVLLTLGDEASAVKDSFQQHAPAALSWHCPTRGQLHRRLRTVSRVGDVILIKGSRSMRMEKTVAYIKKQLI